MTGESGFTGQIDRIDVAEGHIAMDKDPHNHDISIVAILKVIRGRKPRSEAD